MPCTSPTVPLGPFSLVSEVTCLRHYISILIIVDQVCLLSLSWCRRVEFSGYSFSGKILRIPLSLPLFFYSSILLLNHPSSIYSAALYPLAPASEPTADALILIHRSSPVLLCKTSDRKYYWEACWITRRDWRTAGRKRKETTRKEEQEVEYIQ